MPINYTMPSIEQILEHSQSTDSMFAKGIYYLIDGNEVVYVGQSFSAYYRLYQHSRGGKRFDKFAFVNVPNATEQILNDLEAFEIIRFNPKYNNKLPENSIYANVLRLKRLLDCDAHKIKRFIKNRNLQSFIACNEMYYKIAEFREFKK